VNAISPVPPPFPGLKSLITGGVGVAVCVPELHATSMAVRKNTPVPFFQEHSFYCRAWQFLLATDGMIHPECGRDAWQDSSFLTPPTIKSKRWLPQVPGDQYHLVRRG
jgi:hypothetical protein